MVLYANKEIEREMRLIHPASFITVPFASSVYFRYSVNPFNSLHIHITIAAERVGHLITHHVAPVAV